MKKRIFTFASAILLVLSAAFVLASCEKKVELTMEDLAEAYEIDPSTKILVDLPENAPYESESEEPESITADTVFSTFESVLHQKIAGGEEEIRTAFLRIAPRIMNNEPGGTAKYYFSNDWLPIYNSPVYTLDKEVGDGFVYAYNVYEVGVDCISTFEGEGYRTNTIYNVPGEAFNAVLEAFNVESRPVKGLGIEEAGLYVFTNREDAAAYDPFEITREVIEGANEEQLRLLYRLARAMGEYAIEGKLPDNTPNAVLKTTVQNYQNNAQDLIVEAEFTCYRVLLRYAVYDGDSNFIYEKHFEYNDKHEVIKTTAYYDEAREIPFVTSSEFDENGHLVKVTSDFFDLSLIYGEGPMQPVQNVQKKIYEVYEFANGAPTAEMESTQSVLSGFNFETPYGKTSTTDDPGYTSLSVYKTSGELIFKQDMTNVRCDGPTLWEGKYTYLFEDKATSKDVASYSLDCESFEVVEKSITELDSTGHAIKYSEYSGNDTLKHTQDIEYLQDGTTFTIYKHYDEDGNIKEYFGQKTDKDGSGLYSCMFSTEGKLKSIHEGRTADGKTVDNGYYFMYQTDGTCTGFDKQEYKQFGEYTKTVKSTNYKIDGFVPTGKEIPVGVLESYTVYEYDSAGNEISKKHYDAAGKEISNSVASYEERADRTPTEEVRESGSHYWANYQCEVYSTLVTNKYGYPIIDKTYTLDGKLLRYSEYSWTIGDGSTCECIYQIDYELDGSLYRETTYKYDNEGRTTEIITQNGDRFGRSYEHTVFDYSVSGIKKSRTNTYDKDGKLSTILDFVEYSDGSSITTLCGANGDFRNSQERDKDGNLVREKKIDVYGNIIETVY